jgi:hypothetical protein
MAYLANKHLKLLFTVKPELTATSEQWPPANNGQPKPSQIKFNSNFD